MSLMSIGIMAVLVSKVSVLSVVLLAEDHGWFCSSVSGSKLFVSASVNPGDISTVFNLLRFVRIRWGSAVIL